MIPLLGFAPDADPTTPGVITDCSQLVPYKNGMQTAPGAVTPNDVPALAAACVGASVVDKMDGSRRIIAGTATKLYELSGGAWSAVTRTVGGNYTGGTDTRWTITQFGDATLCTNKTDTMQRSTSGAFANISGAPKADIVFNVGAFVMAMNYNDGTDTPDGWYCSAIYDETDWTTSTTTQCNKGRLVTQNGKITAGARLGEYAVAYKANAIYLGQYVGAPVVWDWTPVSGEAGCVGKNAICDIGGAHFFVGRDNFWIFNGSTPVPVGDQQVRQWFFDNCNNTSLYKTICHFDRQNNLVWVYFPSSSSSTPNSALVYNLLSKQWGRANRDVEAVLTYIPAGFTYNTWDTAGATYDTLPDYPYDSQYWLAGGQSLSVFNTSHQLQLMNGTESVSTLTTGDYGDDDQVMLAKRIRLRFASGEGPSSATVQTYSKMGSGDAFSTGPTGSMVDGKFDFMRAARWHRASFTINGAMKVTHMAADFKPVGRR